jgi:hypothetical protein
MTVSDIQINYQKRLDAYNKHVADLSKKRTEFYQKNPDFPFRSMYMNVTAPPQKFEIKILT